MVDAELSADVVRRVRAVADVCEHQAKQLVGAGHGIEAHTAQAVDALNEHLTRERPWRELADAQRHADIIKAAYVAERTRLLARQEEEASAARGRVKSRDGYVTLSNDQSHAVLRPILEARTDTTAEAVSPPLVALGDAFDARLQRAEDEAIEALDELRATKTVAPVTVVKFDLGLKNRELSTEQEVDVLLADLRERLLTQLKGGIRVRLL